MNGGTLVHILVEDQATPLCGEALDDGDRTVSWAHRSEADCDDCLSEAWQRHVRERVPIPGEAPLDGTFPDDAPPRPQLEQLFERHGRELLRALFAWHAQGGAVTRWTTKTSRKLAHVAHQLMTAFPDATAELRGAGRSDAIEATVKRIQSLATPKGRAAELLRIREELATMVGDLDAIAGSALDAAEDEEQLAPEALTRLRREGVPAQANPFRGVDRTAVHAALVDPFSTDEQRVRDALRAFGHGGAHPDDLTKRANARKDERPEGRKDERPAFVLEDALRGAGYFVSDLKGSGCGFYPNTDGSLTIKAAHAPEGRLHMFDVPIPPAAVAGLAAYLEGVAEMAGVRIIRSERQTDERPDGRKDEGTTGRFAFADKEGPTLTFLNGKASVNFTPVSGGIGIVWNGRPKSLCLTHDDAAKLGRWCSSWGTPTPEQLPATLHAAADLLLARYLVAHPKALPSQLSVMDLVEWSAKQTPVTLPKRPPPLTRTRELLRQLFHKWKESAKDPRTGGGELDFDLLSDVADAFEAEDTDV